MPEISVRLSRKVGAGKGDATKAVKGKKPDPGQVSGQRATIAVVCWFCFAVNEIAEPTPGETLTYTCWNCAQLGMIW